MKTAATDHPVHSVIRSRFSPYAFADRGVPEEDLRSLFEAARWAPSSYNEQPWRYLVARREEPEAFARLLSCLVEGNVAWARFAPVLALGTARRTFSHNGKANRTALHDLGLATATLTFEAGARGLSVHQMGGILPERARELYGIPDDWEVVTGIAVGYAGARDDLPEELRARDARPRRRRPLGEIVFAGGWGEEAGWLDR